MTLQRCNELGRGCETTHTHGTMGRNITFYSLDYEAIHIFSYVLVFGYINMLHYMLTMFANL